MSTYPATTYADGVELTINSGNQLHEIINGTATEEITTESGMVPSVRKAIADSMLFKQAIDWAQGSVETDPLQTRNFNGTLFWAPAATTANPIAMGASPVSDSNWSLAPVGRDTVAMNANLISNSHFEFAGTVTNPPDAVARNYDDGDEIFSGIYAKGDITNVTFVDGVINGFGELYVDVVKNTKMKEATSGVISSIAGTNGEPYITGSSVADAGDYYRVTFSMNNTFSVKLEQGSVATGHSVKVDYPSVINVKDFGAAGDGVTDDTSAIQAAISASSGSCLVIPEGTYKYEPTSDVLIANMRELHILGDIRYIRHGLRLENSNLKMHGKGSLSRDTKSTDPTINYQGNYIKGENVTVEGLTFQNGNGYNLACNLKRSVVRDCSFLDGQIGLFLSPSCSYLLVDNCDISDNDVCAGASGADGINSQRNVDNLTVSNCRIHNNGEHGVYYQGDNGKFLNNHITKNQSDGLKFGSYNTGLAPDKNNNERVVSRDGLTKEYGGYNILIQGNTITSNLGLDGIYFQPSYDDVVIKDNILFNNGIRCVYFNYTDNSRLERNTRFTVSGNLVKGTPVNAYIDIAADERTVIENNVATGKIRIYAANPTTDPATSVTIDALIRNNICLSIEPSRATNPRINGNEMTSALFPSNSTSIDFQDNWVKGQDVEFDTNRCDKFNYNKVVMNTGLRFNDSSIGYSFPYEFKGNVIDGDYAGSYFINSSNNADRPQGGVFSDNQISSPSTGRMVRLEGQDGTVSGNVLTGSGSQDIAIDCHGDRMTITGNRSESGNITLRNNTKNVVVGNGIKCTDDQSSNINLGNLA